MSARFVIERLGVVRMYWKGGHDWALHPINAKWFDSREDAEYAALRGLPDQRGEWCIRELDRLAEVKA